ncbi:MAG: hypothetical protein IKF82_05330 [Bacilli bacterium]|nr:hypothetical protein [Bacilli bacterium]
MDLSDEELKATKNEIDNEKIVGSLDKEILKLETVIDFDAFDYWEKEIYCYEILKKIKKGEVI